MVFSNDFTDYHNRYYVTILPPSLSRDSYVVQHFNYCNHAKVHEIRVRTVFQRRTLNTFGLFNCRSVIWGHLTANAGCIMAFDVYLQDAVVWALPCTVQ